jgi:hypothetical protein
MLEVQAGNGADVRLNEARSTGWEYMSRLVESTDIQVIMAQVCFDGLPEHGGWELMLPWVAVPNRGALVIFKRPLSAIEVARTLPQRQPLQPSYRPRRNG